jgi:hypothetical protein
MHALWADCQIESRAHSRPDSCWGGDAQAHQAQISMGSLCDARLPLISEEREQLPREEEEDHRD